MSPVCAPTRAALLTGRRPMSTGTYYVTRGGEVMDDEEVTLAEILKDHGYATGYFGKWHNGAHHPHHPLSQGFDTFFGFTGGHWNRYFDPELEENGRMVRTEGYILVLQVHGQRLEKCADPSMHPDQIISGARNGSSRP